MMIPKNSFKRVFSRAFVTTAVLTTLLATSCQKEATPAPTYDAAASSGIKLNTSFKNSTALSTFLGTTINWSSPVALYKKSNVTLSGLQISGGSSPCIQLTDCTNIHITKCKLSNCTNYAILIGSGCSNILVDSCLIKNVATGVFAVNCPNGQIRVQYNQFQNMTGPYPKGAFVQFSSVGGHFNRIQYNVCENISGQSTPEDGISVYKSSGVAGDPIYVIGNKIRGGGPSTTGAGITIGDGGGSYVTAEYNVLVNTGHMGMQIAGGTNMKITQNTIYSSVFSWSHVGVGCGNYSSAPCGNLTVSYNKVKWWCGYAPDLAWYKPQPSSIEYDDCYQASLGVPSGWSTNNFGASISSSILPATMITWQ
ncbi:MAG TPA: right-handed parallel beta-helix repeat-containing protein [Mucilaginibacter sp.]|nr:right-handed parallel beta-helix repeat-containing protein [Mucilaginibacter sp.]